MTGRGRVEVGNASVELGQRLATRAMALARSHADVDASVVVLLGFARGDHVALTLTRARCQAAVDQDATDAAAQDGTRLLTAALDRGRHRTA